MSEAQAFEQWWENRPEVMSLEKESFRLCFQDGWRAAFDKVTRLTVVNHAAAPPSGRVFEIRDIAIEPSLQDEGRTLKIFVKDP